MNPKETKKKKNKGKKMNKLLNFVGGNSASGSCKKEPEKRTSSDYYSSKIQALEKAISEMRSRNKPKQEQDYRHRRRHRKDLDILIASMDEEDHNSAKVNDPELKPVTEMVNEESLPIIEPLNEIEVKKGQVIEDMNPIVIEVKPVLEDIEIIADEIKPNIDQVEPVFDDIQPLIIEKTEEIIVSEEVVNSQEVTEEIKAIEKVIQEDIAICVEEHIEENSTIAIAVQEPIEGNTTIDIQEPFDGNIAIADHDSIAVGVEPVAVEENLIKSEETSEKNTEEEEDPLSFIQIKSAAQWKAVSKRISWNFDEDTEKSSQIEEPEPLPIVPIKDEIDTKPIFEKKEVDVKRDYENIQYDIYCPEYDNSIADFKPTKVQQLRLICWKIKPWRQPKPAYGKPRLFSSTFAAPWGCDCDEVHPGLFIGDKASATNVAFLKRYGITHVLNAAEGCEEGLVDLSPEHYSGSGITYLGFPLWDAPGCNLTPYLGIAADYIYSAIDSAGGKILVNCQMGVSRSASCALAYLMIHKAMTAVEGLTLVRRSRDCRPNDGFLGQLINLDNDLRLEREHQRPRKIKLSTLQDKFRLPLSWHCEFWMPNEVTEEELGFPLLPMGHCILSLKLSSPSLSNSNSTSRSSSKRNSFKAGLCADRSLSRKSSFKRSRPASVSNEDEWEWVWESDDEEEEEEEVVVKKLSEVNEIIGKPEEKWRSRASLSSSRCSSFCQQKATVAVQVGVEENDPLSMVKVASAKQWKTISRKLTINFDDLEEPEKKVVKTPLDEALEEFKLRVSVEEEKKIVPVMDQRPQTPQSFKPTTVQALRRLCWQIKPWDQPRKTFAERQLFTSILATPWGVDADEVHPRILVGDQAAARNIAFLKRFGITHVLNAAEGPWTEHCVDLNAQHYDGSDITYLGLPLWDSTDVKILQYLGCAADFIKKAMNEGQKCLVNCQMGVSRSCTAAMSYLMIHEGMDAIDILRDFRKRRDVRPNDYFMEQIVELDNDLRKERECGIPRSIKLTNELCTLPKPWHYEFWNQVPDDLPFGLTNMSRPLIKPSISNRTSIMSNESSDWEWEYYSQSEEDTSTAEE